jgi:hypothetical protein
MRGLVAAGILGAALVLHPDRAHAIFDLGGSIQANSAASTVNVDELTFLASGTFAGGAADPNGPLAMSHPALDLYSLSGNLATLVATSTSSGAGSAQISAPVDAGTYLFVASAAPLAPGTFGPLNTAAANSVSFTYDFGLGGALGNETNLVCAYTGNLTGTFGVNSGCQNPPAFTYQAAVPEPTSFSLGAGACLLTLVALHIGRRPAGRLVHERRAG